MDADGAILISALQGCVWALKQNLPHGTDKLQINFNYFLYLKQYFMTNDGPSVSSAPQTAVHSPLYGFLYEYSMDVSSYNYTQSKS